MCKMKRLIIAMVLVSFVGLSVASLSTMSIGATVPLNQKKSTAIDEPNSSAISGGSADNVADLQGFWGNIWRGIKKVAFFVVDAVNYYMCNYYPDYWPSYFCRFSF